jgi:transposase
MGDIEQAVERGYVDHKPCYSSVGHFMQDEALTPILVDIVKTTSLPLIGVESEFAIDSTGFGTSCLQRWYSFKHGKDIRTRTWVKCHFMTGVKTNIITSVKITSEFDNDSPQLPELIKRTSESFDMSEVSCDKAYSSRKNLETISEAGAMPYIPFKSNTKARCKDSVWTKMYHYFMLNQEVFFEHYHKRSNAETTVHMIKSKFGDSVRSKTWTAQVNEVLCKVICHNICVVIQEMFELGIEPDFN